jgi:hypothetical protein
MPKPGPVGGVDSHQTQEVGIKGVDILTGTDNQHWRAVLDLQIKEM